MLPNWYPASSLAVIVGTAGGAVFHYHTPITLREHPSVYTTPASVWRMQRPVASVVFWQRSRSGSDFDPVCSFCGRKRSDGNRRLIAGSDRVYICDECADLCIEIFKEEREA